VPVPPNLRTALSLMEYVKLGFDQNKKASQKRQLVIEISRSNQAHVRG